MMKRLLSNIALIITLSSCNPKPTYKEAPGGFQLELEAREDHQRVWYSIVATDINKPEYCRIQALSMHFPGSSGIDAFYDCNGNLQAFYRYARNLSPSIESCDMISKMVSCKKFDTEGKEFLIKVKSKVDYEAGMKRWKKENK
jgi:hypothetical protein